MSFFSPQTTSDFVFHPNKVSVKLSAAQREELNRQVGVYFITIALLLAMAVVLRVLKVSL